MASPYLLRSFSTPQEPEMEIDVKIEDLEDLGEQFQNLFLDDLEMDTDPTFGDQCLDDEEMEIDG